MAMLAWGLIGAVSGATGSIAAVFVQIGLLAAVVAATRRVWRLPRVCRVWFIAGVATPLVLVGLFVAYLAWALQDLTF